MAQLQRRFHDHELATVEASMQEVANMQAIVTAALVEQTEALDTISANVLGCHTFLYCSNDLRPIIVLRWLTCQIIFL